MLEAAVEPDGLAKRGLIFLVSEFIPVAAASTVVVHVNVGWSEGEPFVMPE